MFVTPLWPAGVAQRSLSSLSTRKRSHRSIKVQESACRPELCVLALRVVEELQAKGHPNILATHSMTFEITKGHGLSRRGDCVVAVEATKGLLELSAEFKKLCRNEETRITVELEAAGITEFIRGRGNPALTLNHISEIVGRRSNFVSDRTLMIRADKAACDINRDLVRELKSSTTRVQVRIIAEL